MFIGLMYSAERQNNIGVIGHILVRKTAMTVICRPIIPYFNVHSAEE